MSTTNPTPELELKKCPACDQDIAKSEKVCPKCSTDLDELEEELKQLEKLNKIAEARKPKTPTTPITPTVKTPAKKKGLFASLARKKGK